MENFKGGVDVDVDDAKEEEEEDEDDDDDDDEDEELMSGSVLERGSSLDGDSKMMERE